MSKWIICVALLLSAAQSASSNGGLSDNEARVKAVDAVTAALGESVKSKLYTQRVERFESEFLDYEVCLYHNTVGQGIYVYEVSEGGCDAVFSEKGGRVCTLVTDADLRWYVAVARRSGEPFRLSGFEDSTAEFNRMATELHVRLANEDKANDYALFFLSLAFGPETSMHGPQSRLVRSEFELKQTAEADFRWCYDDPGYEGPFEAWWRRFKTLKTKPRFDAKGVKQEGGIKVVVPVLRLMGFSVPPFKRLDKEPVLEEFTVDVSADGHARVVGSRPSFPHKSR